jgi:hypothetical protein
MFVSTLSTLSAYSQVDYFYGANNKGFRLGIGGGVSLLGAHYNSNPPSGVATGNLDYDFSRYFSIGLEGQFGQLVGNDPQNKQYFSKSTDTYFSGNINLRVSIGAISDYETLNGFQDAIKRIYVGTGVGMIQTDIKFGPHISTVSPPENPSIIKGHFYTIPINFGTNINLPGILGRDKLELNPNYQYNYLNTTYLDGIGPSHFTKANSSNYSLISLSLKYKF